MKQKLLILTLCVLPVLGKAQTAFYNNGATIVVSSSATVQVKGNLTNNTGTLTNNGTLRVTGNITNNSTLTQPSGSTLRFEGTTAQILNGTQIVSATNVEVNNTVGVTLNTPLSANGAVTFTSGIVTASNAAAPLILEANASVNGTPTNASHVNGYVRWLGTASFIFPTGNGTKYQPVAVNLGANSAGLTARYLTGDAGSATFTPSGTEAAPLVSYNNKEYWDLSPVGTATGTATLYWDAVNETPYAVSARRVAHKVGGTWQNEGGTGSGTTSEGSITSNVISSWSPFTVGSISFPLPTNWLSLNGSLTAQKAAVLQWNVAEKDVERYEVERSADARNYSTLATLSSKGDGTHDYTFTEGTALIGTAYYRVKQVDRDGRTAYSAVVKLSSERNDPVTIYPNPAKDKVVVSVPASLLNTEAVLSNLEGKALLVIRLKSLSCSMDMGQYPAGTYMLRFANSSSEKIIKQ